MTVRELIEELEKFDGDLEVLRCDSEWGSVEVGEAVKRGTVVVIA